MFNRGETGNAEKFLGMLAQHFPGYLPGWVALAQVQLCLEHKEAFRASMERIAALHDAAGTLALDDRIGLAAVLASAGDAEGLRTQIRQCVETANEVELRKLSGNTLLCFVLFAQDTGAGSSRPEIIRMARELLPAELLKQAQADTSGR